MRLLFLTEALRLRVTDGSSASFSAAVSLTQSSPNLLETLCRLRWKYITEDNSLLLLLSSDSVNSTDSLSAMEHPLFRDHVGLLRMVKEDVGFVVDEVLDLINQEKLVDLRLLVDLVREAIQRTNNNNNNNEEVMSETTIINNDNNTEELLPKRLQLLSALAKGLILLHLQNVCESISPIICCCCRVLSMSSLWVAKLAASKGLVNELKSIVVVLKIRSQSDLFEIIEAVPFNIDPSNYYCLLETAFTGEEIIGYDTIDFGVYNNDFKELINYNTNSELEYQFFLTWILKFTFSIDSYGFSSLALQLITYCLEMIGRLPLAEEVPEDSNNLLLLLHETKTHLFHFCNLIYGNFIDNNTSFVDWLILPLPNKVGTSIQYCHINNVSIANLLQSNVKEMFDGADQLLAFVESYQTLIEQLLNNSAFVNCIQVNLYKQKAMLQSHNLKKKFENSYSLSLPSIVLKELLSCLQSTGNKNNMMKQIKDILQSDFFDFTNEFGVIIELVVVSCKIYDDIDSGFDSMDNIVESLPEEEYFKYLNENSDLPFLFEYHRLRATLAFCKIIKLYMELPPLTVLIANSNNRVIRWKYKLKLLVGCGFYVPESSDINSIHNSLSLEQCLIIKMCSEFYIAYLNSSEQKKWYPLCIDVNKLCKYHFSEEDYSSWAVQTIFQCLLYYDIYDEFIPAVSTVFGRNQSINNDDLGFLFLEMNISEDSIKTLLLQKSSDMINSVSSLSDPLVDSARKIFNLIPTGEQLVEESFYELIDFLNSLELDFIPIQLRMMSAFDILDKVLLQRPEAYFSIISYGESFEDSVLSPSYETKQDILAYESVLDSRPVNKNFFGLLLNCTKTKEKINEEGLLISHVKLTMTLVKTALSLSDFENVYCLTMSILRPIQNFYKSLITNCGELVLDEVVELTLLVIKVFQSPSDSINAEDGEYKYNEHYFNKKLGEKLQSELIAACPASSIEKLLNFNSNYDKSIVADVSMFHVSCLEKVENLLESLFELSTEGISSHFCSSLSINFALDEAVNYSLLITDVNLTVKVTKLFKKLLKDLEIKLIKCSSYGSTNNNVNENLPNELFISQLVTKGFSYNAAKRAVINTNNRSLKEALLWAVEHSSDKDIDLPITQTVLGALLPFSASDYDNYEGIKSTLNLVKRSFTIYKSAINKNIIEDVNNVIEDQLKVIVPVEHFNAAIEKGSPKKVVTRPIVSKEKEVRMKVEKLNSDDDTFFNEPISDNIIGDNIAGNDIQIVKESEDKKEDKTNEKKLSVEENNILFKSGDKEEKANLNNLNIEEGGSLINPPLVFDILEIGEINTNIVSDIEIETYLTQISSVDIAIGEKAIKVDSTTINDNTCASKERESNTNIENIKDEAPLVERALDNLIEKQVNESEIQMQIGEEINKNCQLNEAFIKIQDPIQTSNNNNDDDELFVKSANTVDTETLIAIKEEDLITKPDSTKDQEDILLPATLDITSDLPQGNLITVIEPERLIFNSNNFDSETTTAQPVLKKTINKVKGKVVKKDIAPKVKKLNIEPDNFFDDEISYNVDNSNNNKNSIEVEVSISTPLSDNTLMNNEDDLTIDSFPVIVIDSAEKESVSSITTTANQSIVDEIHNNTSNVSKLSPKTSIQQSDERLYQSRLEGMRESIFEHLQEIFYFDRFKSKSAFFTNVEMNYLSINPDIDITDIASNLSNHILNEQCDKQMKESAFRMMIAIIYETSTIQNNLTSDKMINKLSESPIFLSFVSTEIKTFLQSESIIVDSSDVFIIYWYVAALRYKDLILLVCANGYGITEDQLVTVLTKGSSWFLVLLIRLYEIVDGTNLILVEKLKKISSEILSIEDNYNNYEITLQSIYNTTTITAQVIKSLQQNQLDDIASLRRIGRISNFEGIDCKKIIQSGYLFASFPNNNNKEMTRIIAMNELSRFFNRDNILNWNRAVGRILDTGPAELHFNFIVTKIVQLQSNKDNLSETILDIGYAINKLRTNNFLFVCLFLIGVPIKIIEIMIPSIKININNNNAYHEDIVKILISCIIDALSYATTATNISSKKAFSLTELVTANISYCQSFMHELNNFYNSYCFLPSELKMHTMSNFTSSDSIREIVVDNLFTSPVVVVDNIKQIYLGLTVSHGFILSLVSGVIVDKPNFNDKAGLLESLRLVLEKQILQLENYEICEENFHNYNHLFQQLLINSQGLLDEEEIVIFVNEVVKKLLSSTSNIIKNNHNNDLKVRYDQLKVNKNNNNNDILSEELSDTQTVSLSCCCSILIALRSVSNMKYFISQTHLVKELKLKYLVSQLLLSRKNDSNRIVSIIIKNNESDYNNNICEVIEEVVSDSSILTITNDDWKIIISLLRLLSFPNLSKLSLFQIALQQQPSKIEVVDKYLQLYQIVINRLYCYCMNETTTRQQSIMMDFLLELLLVDCRILQNDDSFELVEKSKLFKIDDNESCCNYDFRLLCIGVLLGPDSCSEVLKYFNNNNNSANNNNNTANNNSINNNNNKLIQLLILITQPVRLNVLVQSSIYSCITRLSSCLPSVVVVRSHMKSWTLIELLQNHIDSNNNNNNNNNNTSSRNNSDKNNNDIILTIKSISAIRLCASLVKEGLFVYACYLFHNNNNYYCNEFSMDYCLRSLALQLQQLSEIDDEDEVVNSANLILKQLLVL